jgi:hypothetical protein
MSSKKTKSKAPPSSRADDIIPNNSPSADSIEEDQFIVSHILAEKSKGGKPLYLVKWEGYPEEEYITTIIRCASHVTDSSAGRLGNLSRASLIPKVFLHSGGKSRSESRKDLTKSSILRPGNLGEKNTRKPNGKNKVLLRSRWLGIKKTLRKKPNKNKINNQLLYRQATRGGWLLPWTTMNRKLPREKGRLTSQFLLATMKMMFQKTLLLISWTREARKSVW